MAHSFRSVTQNPFVVNLVSGKMVTDTGDHSTDGFNHLYDRKVVEGDSSVTVLPQLKVIREPKEPTTPPPLKIHTEKPSQDYLEAMLHRPNYTASEPQESHAFRSMAKEHILNMTSRGACSSDFCKAYRGTQEVEFDSSTDCRNEFLDRH